MKKNLVLLTIATLVVVGSIGAYVSFHKPAQTIVTEGHALLPELKKEELIRESDVILLAQVNDTRSIKTPSVIRENEEDIVTNVTLNVENYLRNPKNISLQTLTVQILGGTVGSVSMDVSGVASFKKGERVLVFLKENATGIFTVYGWAQGKYTIGGNGEVGVGEQELTLFHNVFGKNLTLNELESEIKSVENVTPIK